MELYVNYDEVCTDSYQEDVEWGSWSADYSFSMYGASLTPSKQYSNEAFDVPFVATVGDTVFALYMTYSSGDTFGHSTGQGEVLWVFKDESVAKSALAVWAEKEKESADSIEFPVDDGTTRTMSNPASGYFEDCGSLDLQEFVITK